MFGKRWAIAGVLALAVLAVACGGSDKKEESAGATTAAGGGTQAAATGGTQAPAASNVKRGGTLIAGLGNDPKTFDPMMQNDVSSGAIIANVFEGLVKYDENLKPQPWLAEKIDINADSTEFTFTLRKGVKFHDGTEMDAEAVKFSMERIRNNKASVRYADTKEITDILTPDKNTVVVKLSEPFVPFLARLTAGLGAVVSPTAVKALGDEAFGLKPVGTGPFKFVEWKSAQSVRVAKNEAYWKMGADGKALPYVDAVEWRVITEPAVRLTALQAGDIDLFAANTNPRDADVPIIKKDASLVYKEGPALSWSGGIWLTINKPPFDNKALRQALAHAIDRDEVNKAIYEGSRVIATTPMPPPFGYARDASYNPYPYDPAKAKAKLAEGGKPNGFEFEMWINAGDEVLRQWADLLTAQLAKVGIKMNAQYADFNGVVIPKLQKQESNSYALGLTGGVDPDQQIQSAWATGGGFNFFPYSNPAFDELIKKGRATSNLEERGKIYKEAQKILMEDSPYIFITYPNEKVTVNKKVQGWYLGSKATAGYSEFWKQ